ncbi:hypothetical protein LO762_07645 [Actinocorallia sp. API 0066]|uniref:hypothetical protein n=1 Tax=Actinocorallia sp. API 0066 TaxID=2896846 RepID=UPI001E5276A2|nr:hypothetical protein [Actinocorallia sp. API 0066]MCD0449061.1 hypothetical protein [Actinocorallia sp. API 0066]
MSSKAGAGAGLGVLAVLACVACCALPVLIAAGVVSGAGAAVLVERMPLVAALLGAAAVAVFALAARRRRHATGCGCAGTRQEEGTACSCAGTRL